MGEEMGRMFAVMCVRKVEDRPVMLDPEAFAGVCGIILVYDDEAAAIADSGNAQVITLETVPREDRNG